MTSGAEYLTISGSPQTNPGGPLVQLTLEGSFKVPTTGYHFAESHIGYNPDNDSVYITAFDGRDVGEVSIPAIVNSTDAGDLNTGTSLQSPTSVLPASNPELIDRFSGFLYLSGGGNPELVLVASQYYDGEADNRDTLVWIDNADDIAGSTKDGFYHLGSGVNIGEGSARAGVWVSPIPAELQAELGGELIFGSGHSWGIDGRQTIGISLYVHAGIAYGATPADQSVTALMDFDLTNPMIASWGNEDSNNYTVNEVVSLPFLNPPPAMFSHMSAAYYGVIVPGTRTYAVFGTSGAHESSVCYKCDACTDATCTANRGSETCGGYCSTNYEDESYKYYWLFSLDDILNAANIYSITPYEYGKMPSALNPFPSLVHPVHGIRGGAIDLANKRLFLANLGVTVGLDIDPVITVYSYP